MALITVEIDDQVLLDLITIQESSTYVMTEFVDGQPVQTQAYPTIEDFISKLIIQTGLQSVGINLASVEAKRAEIRQKELEIRSLMSPKVIIKNEDKIPKAK